MKTQHFLWSWLAEQLWGTCVPHWALITSSQLEWREIHERIRVFLETFLIVNMLDKILMNCTSVQEIWQHHRKSLMMSRIPRKEGIENGGSEETLQSIPFLCFFSKSEKKSRRQISLMSMTYHALGIWTCTQVAWPFRVISPRRCIRKIPWSNGISMLNREIPSRSLRKSEESRARIAVHQENRSSQIAEGPRQSETNCRKRFLWLRRISFDDGSRIEMVPRYCLFDLRNYRAEDWIMFSPEDHCVLFKKRRL